MDITENERTAIIQMKENIRIITEDILDCYSDPKRWCEIKKKMNHILSLLSSIACYSKPDRDLNKFTLSVVQISGIGELHGYQIMRIPLESFCAAANSVRFEFTNGGIKLHIPKIEGSILKFDIPK